MECTEDRSRRASGPLRAALEAGEARFRALIEAGADGVIVVRRDGTIGFVNPAACALMGREADDLIGQPFGIPVVPGETTEVDIPRQDGTVRVAEMRAAATDWRGEPAYLAALRDITERKRAEEAAREALATLRSFYDGAPMMMGVVELTSDDILHVSSNAATARFFGVRAEDLDGQLVSRLGVPPHILGLWAGRYREAERTGTPVRFEYAHEAPRGRTWLSVTVGFIGRTPAGRPQFSFIAEDITERRRAEEQLRDQAERLKEADRRKDEFLAMLAHELRNPLAAISSAVQFSRRPEMRDGIGWARDVMERQVKQLARLVDDLLDVSRISRGKIRLRMETVDIAEVVARAVEAVRPLVEDRGHDLAVAVDVGPLRVEGDPTRLEQVLANLLTNAAKYTEVGGRIAFAARRDGEDVVIAVRDSGAGIAPEMLHRIFEMFTQVDESLDRSQGGLGIGLTLVQKLVEMHGGVVTVASEGRGHGSEFTVRLPASSGVPEAVPETRGPDAPARPSRVLVVDDNVDTAMLCARLLELAGHDVRTAHDGPGALEAAREFRPEFVLLDIGLPGLDGYQVARRIRQEPSCARAVLIAISGYGQEEDRRRALAAGFDRHLIKPVDVDALLALLARPDDGPGGWAQADQAADEIPSLMSRGEKP